MGKFEDLARSEVTSQGDEVWDEIPVSQEEFFREWIKEPLYPRQGELADAALGNEATTWATTFNELQALWGKGSGKDRTSAKILTYVCYKLMCMKDPVGYLSADGEKAPPGLEDKIEIGNVCINERLARDVFFSYFKIMLKNTVNPKTGKNWFTEKGVNLNEAIHKRWVEFPKNITAHSLDSEEYTGEGLNLFFIIFDEVGGFTVSRAKGLYDALATTARSRFPRYFKLMLISYKRNDNDFMMTRFAQAETEPTTFRSGPYATWEVNLKRKREDFAPDYIRDPETSQRIYECKGSTQEGGFFRYKTRVSQVINAGLRDNPIVGEKQSVTNLRDIVFKEWFKPQEHTEYFIHNDLAKGQVGGDACGFAMGHYERDMVVTLPDAFMDALARDTGRDIEEFKQAIGQKKVGAVIDLVLQIKAPASGEVLFEEIRQFIERLRKVEKFPIYRVTYDGWQSMDSIQQLRKAGVNAEELSVDKTNVPYNTLKNVIYEGVFKCYPHQTLIRELEELLVTGSGKVDHPDYSTARFVHEDKINRGSKDVADAVAGCVSLCIDRGKGGFSFGSAKGQGAGPGRTMDTQPGRIPNPAKFESEKLTRYGEKPPSWFKRPNA